MTDLLRVLIDSSLRICVVAGAVSLFLIAARIRSSELRHKAWAAVLAAMLLMPALPSLVPPVRVPVQIAANIPEIQMPAMYVAAAPVARQKNAAPARAERDWTIVVAGFYGAVLLGMLGRLFIGWLAVRRLLRMSRPVAPLGVWESDCIATPLTVGLLRPSVLLPCEWKTWPPEKVSAVLAHEFAHVARRDTLTGFAAHLNRCVFWFHPLAWWLERHLAAVAEQACDDAAIRAVGENRRYAEVLLDMAEMASRAGRRISWQGVGVDGTGMLGARIDRVLRGGALLAKVSRKQKWMVGVGCAAAILIAAACQQSIYSGPLKADPEVAAREQKQADRRAEYQAARTMSPRQIAEAEAAVKRNPQDTATRNKLVTAYHAKKETQQLAAPHQIWLAEHYPEKENAWLWSKLLAPDSFERMKAIWRAAVGRSNASSTLLVNGASFFEYEAHDYQQAEAILLRLQRQAPDEQWRRRLGRIYATVVTQGSASAQLTAAIWKKLDESRDAVLLAAAGVPIANNFGREDDIRPDLVAKGTEYLRRALSIDPRSRAAGDGLFYVQEMQRSAQMRKSLGSHGDVEEQYAALLKLPEAEQRAYLPDLATHTYFEGLGRGNEYYKDAAPTNRRYFELAQTYSQKLLSLCAGRENDRDCAAAFHRANVLLASASVRLNGDRAAALKYLAAAATVKARPDAPTMLLLGFLLRHGNADERKAVIEYCEREGKGAGTDDVVLLAKSAEQLRKGEMPQWYQSQIARN